MNRFPNIAALFIITMMLFACVPQKKYKDEMARAERLLRENAECQTKLKKLQEEHGIAINNLSNLEKENAALNDDTTNMGQKLRKLESLNKRLNELYDGAVKQYKELLANSSNLTQQLNKQLSDKEQQLAKEARKLADLEESLGQQKRDLAEKEKRIQQLQNILNKKDSAVAALKKKITDALIGFNDQDLTVEVKEGKVYVSLSEQLLFQSGSYDVDPKGKEALGKLSGVLNNNPDIQILIEGHTDNEPLRGKGDIKDNWDLSVKRATSIVKILAANGVNQRRIIASGRGEFLPVDDNETKEGRSKNRRTEVILSPKLDELFKILEISQ